MHLQILKSATTIVNAPNMSLSIGILFQILFVFRITSSIMLTDGLDDYSSIADDDIISLLASKFPEPECKYHVRSCNRNGSELKR